MPLIAMVVNKRKPTNIRILIHLYYNIYTVTYCESLRVAETALVDAVRAVVFFEAARATNELEWKSRHTYKCEYERECECEGKYRHMIKV